MEKHSSLDLLLETELRHLYKSEQKVYDNLQELAGKANSPQLRELFLHHSHETEEQIKRLDRIFKELDIDIKQSKIHGIPKLADKGREIIKTLLDLNFTDASKGMNGILQEGKDLLRHFESTDMGDLALIHAAQKVEHFEMSTYKMLYLLAQKYGLEDLLSLLDKSLKEETAMAQKLLDLAHSISIAHAMNS